MSIYSPEGSQWTATIALAIIYLLSLWLAWLVTLNNDEARMYHRHVLVNRQRYPRGRRQTRSDGSAGISAFQTVGVTSYGTEDGGGGAGHEASRLDDGDDHETDGAQQQEGQERREGGGGGEETYGETRILESHDAERKYQEMAESVRRVQRGSDVLKLGLLLLALTTAFTSLPFEYECDDKNHDHNDRPLTLTKPLSAGADPFSPFAIAFPTMTGPATLPPVTATVPTPLALSTEPSKERPTPPFPDEPAVPIPNPRLPTRTKIVKPTPPRDDDSDHDHDHDRRGRCNTTRLRSGATFTTSVMTWIFFWLAVFWFILEVTVTEENVLKVARVLLSLPLVLIICIFMFAVSSHFSVHF
ncbi:hypothetical protein HK101_005138 [Irineochytrium annulatum]|nr:hypothetical protein HK101_005138 [Irineochytrium annulatum]